MQSDSLVGWAMSSVPKFILHGSWHIVYSWWVISLIQVSFSMYLQVLLSLSREFSWVVMTPFLSDMLASMLKLFIFLCLLKSGCTLPVPRPMPPCVIEQPRSVIFAFIYFKAADLTVQPVMLHSFESSTCRSPCACAGPPFALFGAFILSLVYTRTILQLKKHLWCI